MYKAAKRREFSIKMKVVETDYLWEVRMWIEIRKR